MNYSRPPLLLYGGIAVDSTYLYVPNGLSLLVYHSNNLTLFANVSAGLGKPLGVAVAPDGSLVIVDPLMGILVLAAFAPVVPTGGVVGDPQFAGLLGSRSRCTASPVGCTASSANSTCR